MNLRKKWYLLKIILLKKRRFKKSIISIKKKYCKITKILYIMKDYNDNCKRNNNKF